MIYLLTTIHVIACFLLIMLVVLQHGKSADLAATFGGQGSETAFGPRGAATALSRGTTWLAAIFMITSLSLTVLIARRSGTGSVLSNVKPATTSTTPARPATPATPAK